jgi:hypothetical protein
LHFFQTSLDYNSPISCFLPSQGYQTWTTMASFFRWDEDLQTNLDLPELTLLWTPCPGWPWTIICPISASKVVRITDVKHWCQWDISIVGACLLLFLKNFCRNSKAELLWNRIIAPILSQFLIG